ncbi:MAG: hypothetical protein KJ732_02600 [Candidatus Margulisbacteria bacterium]|nr:hypothetical protein [Candidatus Margulisiibacteriota bacterium]
MVVEKEIHTWEYLAELAILAVTAKKTGNTEIAKECRRFIGAELSRQLALIEYLSLGVDSFYTTLSGSQLAEATRGFELLFDIYQEIIDYFYASLRIGDWP